MNIPLSYRTSIRGVELDGLFLLGKIILFAHRSSREIKSIAQPESIVHLLTVGPRAGAASGLGFEPAFYPCSERLSVIPSFLHSLITASAILS